MQQFTVPQFIDVEDKVIGSLSVRQFIIFMFALALVGVAYKIFDFSLFLFTTVVILVVAGLFAFIKISGVLFHYFLLNMLQTFLKPRLRIWNKIDEYEKNKDMDKVDVKIYHEEAPRKYSMSHLNRLSLMVDTKGAYNGDDDNFVDIKSHSENGIDKQLII